MYLGMFLTPPNEQHDLLRIVNLGEAFAMQGLTNEAVQQYRRLAQSINTSLHALVCDLDDLAGASGEYFGHLAYETVTGAAMNRAQSMLGTNLLIAVWRMPGDELTLVRAALTTALYCAGEPFPGPAQPMSDRYGAGARMPQAMPGAFSYPPQGNCGG